MNQLSFQRQLVLQLFRSIRMLFYKSCIHIHGIRGIVCIERELDDSSQRLKTKNYISN